MAVYYLLMAECGRNREDAEAVSRHFDLLPLSLSTGVISICQAWGAAQDEEGYWCSQVVPLSISTGGFKWKPGYQNGKVESVRDTNIVRTSAEVGEVASLLYAHLKSSPPFRYARVGWEVFDYGIPLSELLADGWNEQGGDGLVLSNALWEQCGSPQKFIPFAEGYVWRPNIGDTMWG